MSNLLPLLQRIQLLVVCGVLFILTCRLSVGQEVARNVAPLATVTASSASENSLASAVTDGRVPDVGSRDDQGQVRE